MISDGIGRLEMAQLLGVSQATLTRIAKYSNADMPKPIGKAKTSMHHYSAIYSRAEFMAWLATRPMQTVVYGQPEIDKPGENAGTFNFLTLMFGVDGARKRLARYYNIRPLVTHRMHVININGDNGSLF